jgi:hypothetical protein
MACFDLESMILRTVNLSPPLRVAMFLLIDGTSDDLVPASNRTVYTVEFTALSEGSHLLQGVYSRAKWAGPKHDHFGMA